MRVSIPILALSAVLVTSPATGGFHRKAISTLTGGTVTVTDDGVEVCALHQCLDNKGETRTKSTDEVIEDHLRAVPGYQLLSEADKANIRGAVKTGGVIAIATSDPITGAIIIPIIAGDQKAEVPVTTYKPNPPPTDKSYTVTADCIVQRGDTSFTVAFKQDNAELARVKRGDTIVATAPICTTVGGSISVTSVTMRATSEATPVSSEFEFKWILLGDLKS